MTPEVRPGMVTTIVPAYNRRAMLPEALASVAAQSYENWEIIVVDDGSTDGTADVADNWGAGFGDRFRVVRQANAGPGAAREAGRRLARGEFLQYLDSDDLLLPDKFSAQADALRADPEAAIAYGWTRADSPAGPGTEPHKRTGERHDRLFPHLLHERWWETATPLYRTRVAAQVGPWSPRRLEEDWEHDARWGALGVRLAFCPLWVAVHRHHAGPRLSGLGGYDPIRFADRAAAQHTIAACYIDSGGQCGDPNARRFARSAFLLARQCGAAGLAAESRRLLSLAREFGSTADMLAYRGLAAVVGWRRLGRWCCARDARRNGP